MSGISTFDGAMPAHLAPKTRMIILEGYELLVDIGFHEFEIARSQRLVITVEIWLHEGGFPTADEVSGAWDYDFLRAEIGELASARRFNLQETLARTVYDTIAVREGIAALRVSTKKPDVYPDCKSVGIVLASF